MTKSFTLKPFLKTKLLVFLVLVISTTYCSGQNANRQTYLDYFENNYFSLDRIEGIYSVKLNILEPVIQCASCNYTTLNIDNFDEIAIIQRNGTYEINSISRGVPLGYIEIPSPKVLKYGGGLVVRMNAKNFSFDHVATTRLRYSITNIVTISYSSLLPYDDIFRVFDYEIAKKLSIKCDNDMDKRLDVVCFNYEAEHEFTKIFPSADFKPTAKVFTGTGFLINDKGYVLTNYHVVKKPTTMRGEFNEYISLYHEYTKTKFQGELISFDEGLDLALIKINIPKESTSEFKGLKLSSKDEKISNIVSTVGYPFGELTGNSIKYNKGYVSSETGPLNNPQLYTLNLSINPGNSGGPLLNNRNNVVGVIVSRLNDDLVGSKVENIGFAIKSNQVIDFLNSNAITYQNVPSNDNTEKTIEDVKKGMFMIEFTLQPK
jgi:S1-C subfamily serine protease